MCIGKYAFYHDCESESFVPLEQVEVPKNCEIGEHAFEDDCKVIRKWNIWKYFILSFNSVPPIFK